MDSKKELDIKFKRIQDKIQKNLDKIVNDDSEGFTLDAELENMRDFYEKVGEKAKLKKKPK